MLMLELTQRKMRTDYPFRDSQEETELIKYLRMYNHCSFIGYIITSHPTTRMPGTIGAGVVTGSARPLPSQYLPPPPALNPPRPQEGIQKKEASGDKFSHNFSKSMRSKPSSWYGAIPSGAAEYGGGTWS